MRSFTAARSGAAADFMAASPAPLRWFVQRLFALRPWSAHGMPLAHLQCHIPFGGFRREFRPQGSQCRAGMHDSPAGPPPRRQGSSASALPKKSRYFRLASPVKSGWLTSPSPIVFAGIQTLSPDQCPAPAMHGCCAIKHSLRSRRGTKPPGRLRTGRFTDDSRARNGVDTTVGGIGGIVTPSS